MDIKPIYSALMRNKAGLALIVLQVAITLAVVCNSLFIIVERSELVARPSGMDEANTFRLASLGFVRDYDLKSAIRQDLDLIRSLPGVAAATLTNTVPTSNGGWSTGVDTQPLERGSGKDQIGSALYFADEQTIEAFGTRLIEGRNFRAEEITDSVRETGIQFDSVIVSEALAKALVPEGSAVGKVIYGISDDTSPKTIIGVVDRLQMPWPGAEEVEHSTLVPTRNLGENYSFYVVRAEPGQRDSVMKEVEAKLQAANPGRIIRGVRTVESVRADAYRDDHAMMSILFGVMAAMLLVTGAGIVGLASFWVTRRTKQIGTRRALGARRFNIKAYFQTENGIMVGMGIVLGGLMAYGFNAWLMSEYDAARLPWYYVPVGALVVFALGQLAVWGPAARAARVSPAVATRTA
ncbi:MAG: ABC transporter permease [Xanthomonadales bacterium]|nr:ABC transporter permease [Xanthomonadales bacterium]MBP6692585.1 ABC transporter permease [Xanthomonadales bacterium]